MSESDFKLLDQRQIDMVEMLNAGVQLLFKEIDPDNVTDQQINDLEMVIKEDLKQSSIHLIHINEALDTDHINKPVLVNDLILVGKTFSQYMKSMDRNFRAVALFLSMAANRPQHAVANAGSMDGFDIREFLNNIVQETIDEHKKTKEQVKNEFVDEPVNNDEQ